MYSVITSAKNPRIKQLLQLQQKSSERRQTGLFVLEGKRELQHCVEAGYEVVELYICPELAGDAQSSALHLHTSSGSL